MTCLSVKVILASAERLLEVTCLGHAHASSFFSSVAESIQKYDCNLHYDLRKDELARVRGTLFIRK